MTWFITATPTSCDRPRPWAITSSLAYTQTVRSIIHHSANTVLPSPVVHLQWNHFSGCITGTVEGLLFFLSPPDVPMHDSTGPAGSGKPFDLEPGTHCGSHFEGVFVKVMHWVSDCASPSCDTLGHSDILVSQSDDIVRYQQLLLWLQNISLANVIPSPFSCLSQCHAN